MDDPQIEKSCFLIFNNFWRNSFFFFMDTTTNFACLKIAQIKLICRRFRKNSRAKLNWKLLLMILGQKTTRIALRCCMWKLDTTRKYQSTMVRVFQFPVRLLFKMTFLFFLGCTNSVGSRTVMKERWTVYFRLKWNCASVRSTLVETLLNHPTGNVSDKMVYRDSTTCFW